MYHIEIKFLKHEAVTVKDVKASDNWTAIKQAVQRLSKELREDVIGARITYFLK